MNNDTFEYSCEVNCPTNVYFENTFSNKDFVQFGENLCLPAP